MGRVASQVSPSLISLEPTIENRIRQLTELIGRNCSKDEVADCCVCGGVGPIDYGYCVFCGVGDEKHETQEARRVQLQRRRNARVIGDVNAERTVSDLDRNVMAIRDAKKSAAIGYWELGNLIAENNNTKLWKLRLDKDGNAKYTKFDQFIEAELGIKKSSAYKMMSVAEKFSKDEVSKYGHSKLGMILTVDDETRAKAIKAMEKGASAGDIKALVKPSTIPPESKVQPNPKITVASILGTHEMALLADDGDGELYPVKLEDVCKNGFTGASNKERLANGVIATYKLEIDGDGYVNLIRTVERTDSEAEETEAVA